MATNDLIQFAKRGGWINLTWTPDDTDYQDLFQDGGTLLIGVENDDFCTLAWLDKNRRLHSIPGFIYEGLAENPQIARLGVQTQLVGFESAVTVTLSIDSKTPDTLIGTIALLKPDIGEEVVGTFNATAHPIGDPVPRRSPHWLRWLWRLFYRLDESRLQERTAG